jgi:hypothetical protein
MAPWRYFEGLFLPFFSAPVFFCRPLALSLDLWGAGRAMGIIEEQKIVKKHQIQLSPQPRPSTVPASHIVSPDCPSLNISRVKFNFYGDPRFAFPSIGHRTIARRPIYGNEFPCRDPSPPEPYPPVPSCCIRTSPRSCIDSPLYHRRTCRTSSTTTDNIPTDAIRGNAYP